MMVLGIDPGSQATGFAVVSRHNNRYVLHEAGVIRTNARDSMPSRLEHIHAGLAKVIGRLGPQEVAIEQIFRHKSSESALRLGQARGVALLAAAQAGLEVAEYNNATVKSTVAGHGQADKAQVQAMVVRLLGLQAPLAADASDAVAIAMTHLVQVSFRQRVRLVGGSR